MLKNKCTLKSKAFIVGALSGLMLISAKTFAMAEDVWTNVEENLQSRNAIIAQLITEFKSQKDSGVSVDQMYPVIQSLGRLKAAEAVDVLLNNIDMENPFVPSQEYIPEQFFPCVGALKQIGKPASMAALEKIGTLKPISQESGIQLDPADAKRMALYMDVISGVEDKEVAEFLIRRKIMFSQGVQKKVYQHALKHVSNLVDLKEFKKIMGTNET